LRVSEWLLEGDPSIRWQALRDLTGAPDSVVERERKKIAAEGWGARLLSKQDSQGMWSGLYTPKWTSTTYTMLTLRDFGVPAGNRQAQRACSLLLEKGFQPNGGIAYGWANWAGRGETCVTGMVLSILSYFEFDDDRLDAIASHLLREQMPDGGWNCRRPLGATHGSVNTTISVLEALRFYEMHRARRLAAVDRAQRRGREFLLAHRLFRSHRTGAVIRSEFTRFVFPPRWHYDVLRALDYFQAVDAPRDARLAEAIEIVHNKRLPNGRWPLDHVYKGKTYFEIERAGRPSRWNTLRALRVLKWWERS
jgi:hypothetical protein